MPAIPPNTRFAFTLVELLVVIAIVGIIAAMLVPAVTDPGCGDRTTACRNNLRQVNVALLLHASDHGDRFPWQVSTNDSGTEELISRGIAADHFSPLTNFLKQPSVLLCPFDATRRSAVTVATFNNTNLSYFVALGAMTNSPFSIVAGDRHLSVGNQPVKPGLMLVNNAALGWTPELHVARQGNLAFADGHVETANETALADMRHWGNTAATVDWKLQPLPK